MKIVVRILPFLVFALPGCGGGQTANQTSTQQEEPVNNAVAVVSKAAKADPRDDLLLGTWSLHSIKGDEEKLISNVTVEFTRTGEMISRDQEKVISQGKYAIEGDRLTVTTAGDPTNAEKRELAHITQLSKTELVITNDDNKMKLTFRRSGAVQ